MSKKSKAQKRPRIKVGEPVTIGDKVGKIIGVSDSHVGVQWSNGAAQSIERAEFEAVAWVMPA